MPQPAGAHTTPSRDSVRLQEDSLQTLSAPARSARVLLVAVGAFVALTTVGLHLLIAAVDAQVSMFGLGFWISAGVLLLTLGLFLWLLRAGRVRVRAGALEGIRADTLSLISTHIPWEAVREITVAPAGGGAQLGWRLIGGGSVGYLAGEEAVHITTDPEFRSRLARGETHYPPRKLAAEYWLSVPQADAVAAKLKQLHAAHSSGELR